MIITKLFNVFLGDEPVGVGYPTFKAAQVAARRIAQEHGSLPFEIRPRPPGAPAPRRCSPSPTTGEE